MNLSDVVVSEGIGGAGTEEILKAIKKLPPATSLFSNSPTSEPFKLEEGDKLTVAICMRSGKKYIQLFLPKEMASYAYAPKDAEDIYIATGHPPCLTFTYKDYNYELYLGPRGK